MKNKSLNIFFKWLMKMIITLVLYLALIHISELLVRNIYVELNGPHVYIPRQMPIHYSVSMLNIYYTIPFAIISLIVTLRNIIILEESDTKIYTNADIVLDKILAWILHASISFIIFVTIVVLPLIFLNETDGMILWVIGVTGLVIALTLSAAGTLDKIVKEVSNED